MITRGDLYEISHIAENVEELYNFITNELVIDESKQQNWLMKLHTNLATPIIRLECSKLKTMI